MYKADGAVERKVSWSLVPSLTVAGFLSAIFNIGIWWPASSTYRGDGTLFVVLASLSFGLALGAILWFYDLSSAWRMLAVVGATLTAHLLGLYIQLYFPARSQEYVDISILGNIRLEVGVTSFVVALILCVAFLLFTTPRYTIGRALGVACMCASLEALTVAAVDGAQRGAWISFLTGNLLVPSILWQPSLAFFLAIALVLKQLTSLRSQERPHSSFKRRSVGFGIALMFWLITGTWALSSHTRYANKVHAVQTRVNAEISKSLAEAPGFENLPPTPPKPLDQVLLLQDINGWRTYYPSFRDYPARTIVGKTSAPFPERRTYTVSYGMAGNNSNVRVDVTEYPNAEWATYEVRNTPMDHEFIEHANVIRHLVRFGNHLIQDGSYFFWPSDGKLIFFDCQRVMPDVIDQFLKAYLEKYPSSLS
ncbi:MAG: hypothetical protein ACRD3P_10370 [Terriglobales bacterium]